MFELEEKINKILKDGIPIEGVTVYAKVKLTDYKLSNDKGELTIDMNLNEFVDSLSKKLGQVSLTNLIILCYKKLEELKGSKMKSTLDISRLNKLLLDASELQYDCTYFFDAIIIVPEYTDGHSSGYRDLNIYGIKNTDRYKWGYCVEKIGVTDHIRINSLFKKLKNFQISIDMPYLENIIRIYCRDYVIRVTNLNFDFVKK